MGSGLWCYFDHFEACAAEVSVEGAMEGEARHCCTFWCGSLAV